MAAMGVGGFFLGRANRQPLVEANLAPVPAEPALPASTLPTPFQMGDDDLSQLTRLSSEEAQAVMDGLETKGEKP